jgi:hypothetical protein
LKSAEFIKRKILPNPERTGNQRRGVINLLNETKRFNGKFSWLPKENVF